MDKNKTSCEPIKYTLILQSDAEPGTGLGNELVNQCLPRDTQGLPIIPATHIKGLIRENLTHITNTLGWNPKVINDLMGVEGNELSGWCPVNFSDTVVEDQPNIETLIGLVSRTAVSDRGTAVHNSLRTTERLSVSTKMSGTVTPLMPIDTWQRNMLILGILMLESIGSSRSRGAGRCVSQVTGCNCTPGEMLYEASYGLGNRRGDV